jgi:hypothetical protein
MNFTNEMIIKKTLRLAILSMKFLFISYSFHDPLWDLFYELYYWNDNKKDIEDGNMKYEICVYFL